MSETGQEQSFKSSSRTAACTHIPDFRTVTFEVPVQGNREGSRNILLGFLYRFNKKSPKPRILALAINKGANLPTGYQAKGIATSLTAIVAQEATKHGRIYLNATWHHNAAPAKEERVNWYDLAIAYGHRISHRTASAFEYIYGGGKNIATSEACWILQYGMLFPTMCLSASASASASVQDSIVMRLVGSFSCPSSGLSSKPYDAFRAWRMAAAMQVALRAVRWGRNFRQHHREDTSFAEPLAMRCDFTAM